MTGYLELIGGGGAIAAAIWLWRLQTITRLIKFMSVGALLLGALSILGIVSVAIDTSAALEAARFVWGLLWQVWGWLA